MFKRFSPYAVIGVTFGVLLLIVVGVTVWRVNTAPVETPDRTVAAQVLAATTRPSVPESVIGDAALPQGSTGGVAPVDQTAPGARAPLAPPATPQQAATSSENDLPIVALSYTSFLNELDKIDSIVSEAAINPDTRVTAAAVTNGTVAEQRIITTTFVNEQLDVILGAYTEKNADMYATPASNSRLVATRYGTTVVPAETGASGTNGFLIIMIILSGVIALYIVTRIVLMRRAQKALEGGAGKKNGDVDRPTTRFSDVAGCDEAVEELEEIVSFMKDPLRFVATGAKSPKGALLVGPPGTGKTLLARAVAGEAGVPFYSASGSDFVEMYVGVGAKRVRELFKKARSHPEGAIIFIDEVDSVGRKRSNGPNQHQEQESTLNAMLVEMDGFASSNVIVLAATNRDDMLDPALTRPGRLDKKVSVGLPDRLGREKILRVHAADKPLAEGVDLVTVARRTPGMSGAELAQIVNEACMQAARDKRVTVTDEDFDHAVATVAMGKARTSAVVTEHDRNVTAWHEAGHTVIGMVLPDAMEPVSVSIIPRGPAGGVTWFSQGDDIFLTRKQAFARIVTAMGGRAAEELLLDGEFTSGPYGDLQSATNQAIAMITKYGMTDHGLAQRPDEVLSTGSKLTEDVWAKADEILAEALDMARETIASHRDIFDAVVSGLLEYDTLVASQLDEIKEGKVITPPVIPDAPKDYKKVPPSDVKDQGNDQPRVVNGPADNPTNWGSGLRKRRSRLAGAMGAAFHEWKRQGKPYPH